MAIEDMCITKSKICFKCCKPKSLDNYSWREDLGIWRNTCKECRIKYYPEESKHDRDKGYYEAKKKNVKATSNNHLTYKYGITIEDKERMFDEQGGKCGICKTEYEYVAELYVDHCHKSGNVRALLCTRCNTLLGFAKDDPEILQWAIEYLKVHLKSQ